MKTSNVGSVVHLTMMVIFLGKYHLWDSAAALSFAFLMKQGSHRVAQMYALAWKASWFDFSSGWVPLGRGGQ